MYCCFVSVGVFDGCGEFDCVFVDGFDVGFCDCFGDVVGFY